MHTCIDAGTLHLFKLLRTSAKDFLYLFIAYHLVARHVLHVVEDSRSKQSQIYTWWVGELCLWHYFGADTCSDVNCNPVIGCIDRVTGRYVRTTYRSGRISKCRIRRCAIKIPDATPKSIAEH